MARNRWTIDGDVLTVSGSISGTFNLTEVFPNFGTLDDTERSLIVYGTKQWLSDKIAGSSDPQADLSSGWNRLKAGDLKRQSGAGGVTKKQLVHENERLQQELAELKEMLAGTKNPAVKLKKK